MARGPAAGSHSSIEDILLLGGRFLLVKREIQTILAKKPSHQAPNASNRLLLAAGPHGRPHFSVLGAPLPCLAIDNLSSPTPPHPGIPGNLSRFQGPCRQ